MSKMPFRHYQAYAPIALLDRKWPSNVIDSAPIWCSVDLRDGNQALPKPMDVKTKLRMFELLVRMGFKEIEVGFPAASQTDFDFVRALIDGNLIPDDVSIQVLTQARAELIDRTFESVIGARKVIVHLYNSTSALQRRVVFNLPKEGIIDLAVDAARRIKSLADDRVEIDWMLQYSPESFTGTELDFALEICNAVIAVWQPTKDHKAILNLPATVEMSTPNVYADMIEWMHRNLAHRECIILSVHTHNDRGTGVAATEFGLMAGAERVEGTLLGNGERTGNVDIVNVALNMMTQGIDPMLDIGDINEIVQIAEECTGLPVHPRHPYAGRLAFVAFSGSHQDAIKKGLEAMKSRNSEAWEVPYLHVSPGDIGRSYEPLIGITSQSGKSGVGYVMEEEHGLRLPKGLQIEFAAVVQREAERTGAEVSPIDLWKYFDSAYLQAVTPLELLEHVSLPSRHAPNGRKISASIRMHGEVREVNGRGNGEIDALVGALQEDCGLQVSVLDYEEHAVSSGSTAMAAAYIRVRIPGKEPKWGVGMDSDVPTASLKALFSAVNRAVGQS